MTQELRFVEQVKGRSHDNTPILELTAHVSRQLQVRGSWALVIRPAERLSVVSFSPPKVPSPKRKLEEDEPVLEFRPPRGAITQPLKKLKINVFKVHKCAVCGFTTENLLQFHEHIPQHKSDGSSYQCRECGLCYTSHVSLSRHLFIVHKLKEPQPVAQQNGAGEENQQNQPSPEHEGADGTASDRKCKVCAKTFETEAALNAHMRTHGMAFIKSKRVNSAEK